MRDGKRKLLSRGVLALTLAAVWGMAGAAWGTRMRQGTDRRSGRHLVVTWMMQAPHRQERRERCVTHTEHGSCWSHGSRP